MSAALKSSETIGLSAHSLDLLREALLASEQEEGADQRPFLVIDLQK